MEKPRSFPPKPCRFCKKPFQPTWSGNHCCSVQCQINRHLVRSESGCLEWRGASTPGGYGSIRLNGKTHRAHVVNWQLTNGPVPEGLILRHKCDNPPCCNLDHLEPGTHSENSLDKFARGRAVVGDKHYLAKLISPDIPVIRARLLAGDSCNAIARDYKVTSGTISQIKRGRAWKHS
jgi:hypothetical protein